MSALFLAPQYLLADTCLLIRQQRNYVDCGNPTLLNNMNKFTLMFWGSFTAQAGTGVFWSKDGNAGSNNNFRRAGSGLEIQVQQGQTGGTNLSYITNNSAISINRPYFLAMTYTDEQTTGRVKIFLGSETLKATERTYGTANDGTGTKSADSNIPMILGQNSTISNASTGDIFGVHIVSGILNLAQIQDQQFAPHVTTGTVFFALLGITTPTVRDLSGHVPPCSIFGSTAGMNAWPFNLPGGPNG